MKHPIFEYILALGIISSGLVSCTQSASRETKQASLTTESQTASKPVSYSQEQVLRGEYLVTIMDCDACHSPKVMGALGPEPDPDRRLSGHPQNEMPLPPIDTTLIGPWIMFNTHGTAIAGPWGVSFTANLTSDPTGIGNWTEEQFTRALREGKYKGLANNRDILPPMPWPAYSQLSDEDLVAILAFLKSTKPVKNVPPPPMALKDLNSGS